MRMQKVVQLMHVDEMKNPAISGIPLGAKARTAGKQLPGCSLGGNDGLNGMRSRRR